MKLGVVGLPNVGKSTLFNAITHAGAESANYPFCTIEPNVGIVDVPDERLNKLAALCNSKKITPAAIKFVDIAGLVKGASKGEGLGNKFLSHIREVDAIVHVVRCFVDSNVTHVEETVDPVRDMEIINIELVLADLESVMKYLDKSKTMSKTGDKKYKIETEILQRLADSLNNGKPIRAIPLTDDEKEFVETLFLITGKPVIYAANIAESDVATAEDELPMVRLVKAQAAKEGAEAIVMCAKVEEELSQMDESDRDVFYAEYGINESGLSRMVKKCYSLLGQISYLTSGEPETRAWTITDGTRAPQAAGKIHSDFEKGFIRAEVVPYETLLECGNYNNAKEKGKVRSEGKEYVMKDGDVVLFRFNN